MYRIKNWSTYQDVKRKGARWIKEYTALDEDEDYKELHGLSQNLFGQLRRMAARLSADGSIDLSIPEIRKALGFPKWLHSKHFHDLIDAGFLIYEPSEQQDYDMSKKIPDEELFTSDFVALWEEFPPPEGDNLGKKRRAGILFHGLSSDERYQLRAFLIGAEYEKGLVQCLNVSDWREGEAPVRREAAAVKARPRTDSSAAAIAIAPKAPVEITDEFRQVGSQLSIDWPENELYPKQPERDLAAFAAVAANIGAAQAKYCAEKFLRLLKKRPKEFRKVTLMRNFFGRDEWRPYLTGFSDTPTISPSTTAQSDDPWGLPPPSPILAFLRPNSKTEGTT